MMRNAGWGAVAFLMIVSGCGERAASNEEEAEGSVPQSQVADRARDLVRPEPGLYRSTVEIQEFDIPGAPPQVAEMMRNSMSSNSTEYCLTPEDVAKGYEESIRKSQQGECDYKRFDVDGGKIDAALTCTDQGRTVDLTLSGTGTRTSSDMAMTMKMDMGPTGQGTIRARSRSERIGDCPA